jgi:hypothetical protein
VGLVVDLESLAALDGLLWLRTGHGVAHAFNFSQSFVSRSARRCADVFGVELRKTESEWCLGGDLMLLNLERKVHQHVRWQRGFPLRLEAQHWSGPLLCEPPPSGWITGNLNFLEYHRPLHLLALGVIDAWVASYPDVPCGDDSDIVAIPLSRMPMRLVVNQGHPLLGLGSHVTFADVAQYPCLPLPDGAFPQFEAALQRCGLWQGSGLATRMAGRRGQLDQDCVEDLLVGFSTPLALPLYGEAVVELPLEFPMVVGDALLIRREFSDAPQAHDLAAQLRQRLRKLALTTPDVVVLEHSVCSSFEAAAGLKAWDGRGVGVSGVANIP